MYRNGQHDSTGIKKNMNTTGPAVSGTQDPSQDPSTPRAEKALALKIARRVVDNIIKVSRRRKRNGRAKK